MPDYGDGLGGAALPHYLLHGRPFCSRSEYTWPRIILVPALFCVWDGFNHAHISISVVVHDAKPASRIVASRIPFTLERELRALRAVAMAKDVPQRIRIAVCGGPN